MPAIDSCQSQVIRALEKDGWRIETGSQRFRKEARAIVIDIRASYGANGQSRQILFA